MRFKLENERGRNALITGMVYKKGRKIAPFISILY